MINFQNRAWRILTTFEKLAGFWPYQSRIENYSVRIGISLLILTYSIPLVITMVKEWNTNFYIILENSLVITIILVVMTKILSASLLQHQRQKILEQVALHFEIITDDDESHILRNHSSKGLKLIVTYTVTIIVSCGIYDGLPIARMYFLHLSGQGKLEKKCPLHVDYLVNEQEYFYYILAHLFISLGAGMIAEFSYDLTFFLAIRHTCALFNIVELRLKKALEIFEHGDGNKKLADSDEQKAYGLISSAVDLHNEALQLARSLDEAHNVSWFFILLLNMIFFAPLVLTILFYINNPFELCRYFVALLMILLHFYVIFLQGQLMIDHSSSVFTACYDSSWYITPKETKIAISMMMRHSLTPCRITGCKMFVLSMETYGKMMKTGLSLITIFAAVEY